MLNINYNLKEKIFFLNPSKIIYCTFPSKYCDFTQFKLDRLHPHAGRNSGFFEEEKKGGIKIISSAWDKKIGIKFSELPEFIALNNHFIGKEKWRYSEFADRFHRYIKSDNIRINFNPNHSRWKTSKFNKILLRYLVLNENLNESHVRKILEFREKEIDSLFDSIAKKGLQPCKSKKNIERAFINNISVNLGENNIFFNYRGHHRLAISKILKLKLIPVKITVVKNIKILKNFLNKNNF